MEANDIKEKMRKLEEYLEAMQDKNISIEQSIALYEESTQLYIGLKEKLDSLKTKIELINPSTINEE